MICTRYTDIQKKIFKKDIRIYRKYDMYRKSSIFVTFFINMQCISYIPLCIIEISFTKWISETNSCFSVEDGESLKAFPVKWYRIWCNH